MRSRCLHPGQQHGRRCPSSSSSWVRRMRRSRVVSCLASSTQQMNSLRARGVMSFQTSIAVSLAISALRRSAGSLCTTPPGTLWPLTGCRASDSDVPVTAREVQRPNDQEESCPSVGSVRDAHDARGGSDKAAGNPRDPKGTEVSVHPWIDQALHAGSRGKCPPPAKTFPSGVVGRVRWGCLAHGLVTNRTHRPSLVLDDVAAVDPARRPATPTRFAARRSALSRSACRSGSCGGGYGCPVGTECR